ncbi:hypothetical protein U1Q18_046697 [Sarracenia purpurea var. burkii]
MRTVKSCGCSLRTGTLILLILSVVSGLLGLIYFYSLIIGLETASISMQESLILQIGSVIAVIGTGFSAAGIYGVCTVNLFFRID